MKTLYFKALWGMDESAGVEANLRRIAAAGYDGVEAALPAGIEPARMRGWLDELNLLYIPQIFPLTSEEFARQLDRALEYGPLFVNSHSGRDKYDFAQGCAFFREALLREREAGIRVVHETHRWRMLFSPFATAAYLREFPDLRLCADFSHWTCVCESNLDDLGEIVALAIARTGHTHGRVGHAEGPQVSDPRAPEWLGQVEVFERWWDAIREAYRSRGESAMSFTPEFGPPHYLQTLPFTRQPVTDLWEVNLWMANRERERWTS